MFDDMAPKMAQVITTYSTGIKEGDYVLLQAPFLAAPLAETVYEQLIARGAHVSVQWNYPPLKEIFFRKASDAQLEFVSPIDDVFAEKTDVYIVLEADHNTKSMTGVDPQKLRKQQIARQDVTAKFFARLNSGALRYHLTLWPTDAAAQQAEMGLLAYTEFVYKACALDQPDPVAHWRNVHDRQERLVEWLNGRKRAEVRGPGVDLTFDLDGRKWVNCDGRLNFPDGEIYTCPVEDSVNGRVEFSYPSLYAGREVRGVKLTFKDGVVVEASADKAEDHLLAQLDVDEGARRLGEFAIGTNYGVQDYTGNTLFDEKIGGTIHMALGNAVPDAGGQNQSAVHWDIVHSMRDGGEILIDGEPVYRNGEFLLE